MARAAEQEYERAAAVAYEDAFITERERELQRLERQLGSNLGERDLEEFVRQCASGDGADTASLEEQIESIRADRDRRSERIADLQRQVSRAEGSIESRQQELDKQAAALEGKREALDDSWESALTHAEAELKTLREEDRNLEKELETLETGASNEIEQARTIARQRAQRLAVAVSRSTECRKTVESAREARDRLAGRVDERAALAQREDPAAAHAHLEALRAKFAALPVPEMESHRTGPRAGSGSHTALDRRVQRRARGAAESGRRAATGWWSFRPGATRTGGRGRAGDRATRGRDRNRIWRLEAAARNASGCRGRRCRAPRARRLSNPYRDESPN